MWSSFDELGEHGSVRWLSKWAQSLCPMIKGATQAECLKWCKLANQETEEKEKREKDGNVGGGGREELTLKY